MRQQHDSPAQFDRCMAIAHFAAHYRNGQWSRLYRIGCKAQRILGDRYSIERPLDMPLGSRSLPIYRRLEDNYAEDNR